MVKKGSYKETKLKTIIKKPLLENEIDRLSNNIVDFLKNKHNITSESDNFTEEFNDLVNLYLYEHGLVEEKGLKDYILIDHIEVNRFLIKNRKSTRILFGFSLLDLEIFDNFSIKPLETASFGDYIEDFVALHIISIKNNELANQILNKYGELDRKFFRLLSFYTAVFCLHLISKKDKEKNEIKKSKIQSLIDYIYESYEDFTVEIPTWYK